MENELELRLGIFCVNVELFPTPRGVLFFKLDFFYLIIYLIDSSLGNIVLGRGTSGLRCGLDWELRKDYVSVTHTWPVWAAAHRDIKGSNVGRRISLNRSHTQEQGH